MNESKQRLIKDIYEVLVKADGGNPEQEPWLKDALTEQAELVVDYLEKTNLVEFI